jgi:hypothetical protein
MSFVVIFYNAKTCEEGEGMGFNEGCPSNLMVVKMFRNPTTTIEYCGGGILVMKTEVLFGLIGPLFNMNTTGYRRNFV